MYFRLLIPLLLMTMALYGGSRPYVGFTLESGYGLITQENSKIVDVDVNPVIYGGKFNVGIDSGDDLRTNIYLGLDYMDSDIFGYTDADDIKQGSTSQFVYSVGFDVIRTYSSKGSSTLPYLRGGMDYGWAPLNGYVQSWANNVGFTFGGGTFLRAGAAELQLGVYYKYRLWGNYNLDTEKSQNVGLSDHSLLVELGMNFYY